MIYIIIVTGIALLIASWFLFTKLVLKDSSALKRVFKALTEHPSHEWMPEYNTVNFTHDEVDFKLEQYPPFKSKYCRCPICLGREALGKLLGPRLEPSFSSLSGREGRKLHRYFFSSSKRAERKLS